MILRFLFCATAPGITGFSTHPCAVRADGRVPAPDAVKVSCYQLGMTRAYLCHRHALVPGPIPLPTLVTVFPACKNSMDPGMWIAEVPILSDALLMPLKSCGSWREVRRILISTFLNQCSNLPRQAQSSVQPWELQGMDRHAMQIHRSYHLPLAGPLQTDPICPSDTTNTQPCNSSHICIIKNTKVHLKNK